MERDGRGHPCFSCPPPLRGVGGERSETEGGISTMVKDGGCPFMFDGALSFDRVLMPALRASAALGGHPFHRSRGPPPPASRGRQVLGNVVPLPHRWGRQVYRCAVPLSPAMMGRQDSKYPSHFFPMAVVWPSATPAVLSFMKRIFTVAKMILISSTRLGLAIYMRSIRSLS